MTSPDDHRLRDRLLHFAFEDEFAAGQVATRQVPFTIVFCVALAFGLTVDGELLRPVAVWTGTALVVGVQLAGLLVPWRRLPRMAQIVLPVSQLVALTLLELGTNDAVALYPVLIFVPVVSLAMLPSIWGVVVAAVGAFAAVLIVDLASSLPAAVVRGESTLVLLAAFLVAVGVYGMMSRLRAGRADLQRSRDELAATAERLRATGELWRGLIEAATGHAIVATDSAGRIEVFNQGAEGLLGRSREEAVGTDIVSYYDRDEVAAALVEVGLDNTPAGREAVLVGDAPAGAPSMREWTYLRRDGEPVPVYVVATRRPDQDGGAPGGYLFVATDVTERHEAERLQDEFIGLVSHELRTPLVSVLGYLDLLRAEEEGFDDEQRQYVETIDRNAKRLLRLVNDLLLSVQVSAGKFTLSVEDVDAATIASDSVAAIQPTADAAGVRVDLDAPPHVRLRGDPMRLAQLVENLLTNAVKFTGRGGLVTVRVSEQVGTDSGSEVVISVADNGMGIAPDELDRLTEPFYRTRSARNRRIRGSGLGLSIVQAIVAAHQGELSVQSALGSGTTFTVVIPIAGRAGQAPTPTRPRARTSPQESSARRG